MLSSPNSTVFAKSINMAPPSGPLCPAGCAVTYGVPKELASIIRPLVGQSSHHIKNTQHCMEHIKSYNYSRGNACSPMVSGPSSHRYWWTLPTPSSNVNYYRTLYFPIGLPHPSNKSLLCWSFAWKIPTSSSKVSILIRSMLQPWAPHDPSNCQPLHGGV